MSNEWTVIMNHILTEGKDIHKLYSIKDGWCWLTEPNGNRYKITNEDTLYNAMRIVHHINLRIAAFTPTIKQDHGRIVHFR